MAVYTLPTPYPMLDNVVSFEATDDNVSLDEFFDFTAFEEDRAGDAGTQGVGDELALLDSSTSPTSPESDHSHQQQLQDLDLEGLVNFEESSADVYEEAECMNDNPAYVSPANLGPFDLVESSQQQGFEREHPTALALEECQCQMFPLGPTSLGANVVFPEYAIHRAGAVFPRVLNSTIERKFFIGICTSAPMVHLGRSYQHVCKLLIETCSDPWTESFYDIVWMQGEWTTTFAAANKSLLNMVMGLIRPWQDRIPIMPDRLFDKCSVCQRRRSRFWVR